VTPNDPYRGAMQSATMTYGHLGKRNEAREAIAKMTGREVEAADLIGEMLRYVVDALGVRMPSSLLQK
jgi:hypothetical protein